MEDDFIKGSLFSKESDLKLNISHEETENTEKLQSSMVIKTEKIDSCSLVVQVKQEQEDLPQAVSMENRITSTPMAKMELKWNEFEIPHIPASIMFEEDKPEHNLVVQFELERKVFERNNDCVLDFPDKISIITLDGLFSPQQIEVPTKTEKCEILNESEKKPEIIFDEWKIKHEEVDIKVEHLKPYKINFVSSGDNQQKIPKDDKNHKCHVCGYHTKRKYNLNMHMLRHKNLEEVEMFKCAECEYKTIYKRNFQKHILRHGNPKEDELLKCDQCQYRTSDKSSLKRHGLRHKSLEEVTSFKCTRCDYQTIEKTSLKRHLRCHEDPEKVMFECDKCNYKTIHKRGLKRHHLRHEIPKNTKFFKCDQCGYQTFDKGNLRKHIMRHKKLEEIVMLKCNRCSYKTINKGDFVKHVRRHKKSEEVDMFRCDKCEFETVHKYNLKRHGRILGH